MRLNDVSMAGTRARREDRELAALEVVRSHGAAVMATARRYSATPEDAEDAYQRGLEILLTKAPTTDAAELVPWLRTVVKHEAFALRRQRERHSPVTDDGELADSGTAAGATHEQAERWERLRQGAEAIRRLKPQELRALLLKAEGYSYQEICEITGWTYTKVNRCLTEGRRAFSERIEAREATLHEGYWELKEARVLTPDEEPRSYDTYQIASNLEPSQVRQSFTPPESVPFWELDETIARTERAGLDATRYRLQHDVLLARPLLLIAMVFVAASVSLRFFRMGGVATMVLGGVTAGFVLYVVTKLMEDLGGEGFISSAVAAWFPAVVGSLLGTLALLYQEDG